MRFQQIVPIFVFRLNYVTLIFCRFGRIQCKQVDIELSRCLLGKRNETQLWMQTLLLVFVTGDRWCDRTIRMAFRIVNNNKNSHSPLAPTRNVIFDFCFFFVFSSTYSRAAFESLHRRNFAYNGFWTIPCFQASIAVLDYMNTLARAGSDWFLLLLLFVVGVCVAHIRLTV